MQGTRPEAQGKYSELGLIFSKFAIRNPKFSPLLYAFFCWTTLEAFGKNDICIVVGTWLSLVERCVRDAEVAGSNPVVPTKEIKGLAYKG